MVPYMRSDRDNVPATPAKRFSARPWLRLGAVLGLIGIGLLWRTRGETVPVQERTAEIGAIVREALRLITIEQAR